MGSILDFEQGVSLNLVIFITGPNTNAFVKSKLEVASFFDLP